ncbi:alpha/beta hydrolase [Consotaella salsifontis]|uniref:alpha/beta hydrolase n=1 Tax=Consotaella salsifontis TaxID=1365950 RepID=UPI001A97193E|nr:prolyl oligopeptidase family serine peptidase [Consotaella salsifontis]
MQKDGSDADDNAPRPDVAVLAEGPENRLSGQWPDRMMRRIERPELHSFRVSQPRGQAMIYAGGGYLELVYDKEGIEIARWLNGLGLDAHVMIHRLPGAPGPDGAPLPFDIALRDALAGLDHLAQDERSLPLIHVGLSSGGHLAGVMACQTNAPSAVGAIIAYGPINANHREYKAPAGKPDYPPAEKQAFYDAWPVGIRAHPHAMPKVPLFMAYALHDRSVPVDHALNLARSAAETGLDADLHIFGCAPHGFALRDHGGTHDAWPGLANAWIDRLLPSVGAVG